MAHRETTTGGPHYTEPTVIQDTFTTGAASVLAASDGAVRLTFYVDMEIVPGAIEPEHRIMDRVILPREAIPALLVMLTEVMALHPEGITTIGHRRIAKASH